MSPRKRSQRPAAAPSSSGDAAVTLTTENAEAQAADGDDHDSVTPANSEVSELRAEPSGDDEPASEHPIAAGDVDHVDPATATDDELPEATEPTRAEPPPEPPTTREQLKRVIESLVFVSSQTITAQQIGRIVKVKLAEVRELLGELMQEYSGRGIELVEVASGFQFRSAAASAPFVRDLVAARPVRLTRAQLETLALVAYRQPITRPEIDDVRGVDSGSALKVLLERGLLKILGRKDEPGRPLLYGTAPYFLEFFGMRSMQELPTLREFTDLTDENRELFKRKTGEAPDLAMAGTESIAPEEAEIGDDELFAIAEAAKRAAEEDEGAAAEQAEPTHVEAPEADGSADGADDEVASPAAAEHSDEDSARDAVVDLDDED